MKNLLYLSLFTVFSTFGQVGIGIDEPQALLDVNGDMRIADIPTDLSSNHVLVIGENNVISKNVMPTFFAISGMVIPSCQNSDEDDEGSFLVSVNGDSFTVDWEILVLSEGTTQYSSGNPIRAQRMQVRYNFTPPLPYNPDGFSLTSYNNNPESTVTFSLNYAAKSASSVTINITRTDMTSKGVDVYYYNDCWEDVFYFDMTMYNYN